MTDNEDSWLGGWSRFETVGLIFLLGGVICLLGGAICLLRGIICLLGGVICHIFVEFDGATN